MTHTFACCPSPLYPSVPNSDNFICLLNIFWFCLLLFSIFLSFSCLMQWSNWVHRLSLFKSFNGFIWITFYIHLSLISRPCINWTLPVSPDSNFLTLFLIPYASATVHTFIFVYLAPFFFVQGFVNAVASALKHFSLLLIFQISALAALTPGKPLVVSPWLGPIHCTSV